MEKYKVIIFENEGIVALHLKLLLEQEDNISADTYFLVKDFLDRTKRQDFDLIICDLLPGSEIFFEDLLNFSNQYNIPLIFISENFTTDNIPSSAVIIKKPFDESKLFETVKELLSVNA